MAKEINTKNASKSFDASMQRMMSQYPTDSARFADICQEYQRLFEEVGPRRFDAGVTAIIDSREFTTFPALGEIRKFVPSRVRPPLCGKCQSGWVIAYRKDNMPFMRRCECRGGTEADRILTEGRSQPGKPDYVPQEWRQA